MWSAVFALSRNEAAAAVEALQPVGVTPPLSQLDLVVLGRAYLAQGSLDRAIGAWSKAEAWPELIRAADQADNDRQWQSALLLVSAAKAAAPRDVVSSEARAWRGLGEPEAALRIVSQALATWPNAPEATIWLLYQGDALSDLRRWNEAWGVYEQVSTSRDPGMAYWGFLGMGLTSYRSGNGFAAAAAPIAHAISLFPNYRAGYTVMAELLRSEHRADEAVTWDRRAAAASSTDVSPAASAPN